MLNALNTGELIFYLFGNVVFELRWRGTRQSDGDHHRWQVNIRELLHLHLHKTVDAAQGQQHKQQDGNQRISNRVSGDI